jgi:hypothetical protein
MPLLQIDYVPRLEDLKIIIVLIRQDLHLPPLCASLWLIFCRPFLSCGFPSIVRRCAIVQHLKVRRRRPLDLLDRREGY